MRVPSEPDLSRSLSGVLLGGRYRVGERLGGGGMGTVYDAIEEGIGHRVAIKVLHDHLAGHAELVQRFHREAEAAAALGHPHIIRVTDFHQPAEGSPFLVMERLEGSSLKQRIEREAPLPALRVAKIAVQVLSALAVAHKAQIVHRDIKPDNIFLSPTAKGDRVTLLDFGVAKLLDRPGVTVAGSVVGTLTYMAPEQARGLPVDRRTDLYALAACMHHACTGTPPVRKGRHTDMLASILLTPLPRLDVLRPEIDALFADVVDKALRKEATERFATADEMAAVLLDWIAAREVPSTEVLIVTPPEVAAAQEAPPRRRAATTPARPAAPRANSKALVTWAMAGLVAGLMVMLGLLSALALRPPRSLAPAATESEINPRAPARPAGPLPGTPTAPRPSSS